MLAWDRMKDQIESQINERGFARLSDVCTATGISRQRAHQLVKEKCFVDAQFEYKGRGAIVRLGETPAKEAFNTHAVLMAKSRNKTIECANAIMELDFPKSRMNKIELEAALPNFSYHYINSALEYLISEGKLKRVSAKGTEASPVMKTGCTDVQVGGHCPTDATQLGRIRQRLYEHKLAGTGFYAFGITQELGVNSGLVTIELQRLMRLGEIEKTFAIDKDDSGRKLPQSRQMYRFVEVGS